MLSVCAEAIVPSFGWMEWDVTNHVKDAIREGLSNVDLLIKCELEDANQWKYCTFKSINSVSYKPYCIINESNVNVNKDTYIDSANPTSNYSSTDSFMISKYTSNLRRGIISIPLTDIVEVNTASLKLYLSNDYNSYLKGSKIQVLKLTHPDWVETEATWNSYKTGSNWTTAGGDYVAEVEDLPVASSGPLQRIWPAKFPRKYP